MAVDESRPKDIHLISTSQGLSPVLTAIAAHVCRCDARKAAVIDAGAVAPLLRTFAAGIPELAAHLAELAGQPCLAQPIPDEQRHLHGCARGCSVFEKAPLSMPQVQIAGCFNPP